MTRKIFIEETAMTVMQHKTTITKERIRLFVDRSNMSWIVMDSQGQYWVLSNEQNPWEHRTAYQPDESTRLEPVPGHYKTMLGVPG